MRNFALLFTALFLIVSCHKKTIPTKTEEVKVAPKRMPLVVIDGLGRVITSKSNLPSDEGIKADYSKLERSFTPEQKANLMARHKMIPPRVLYVPKEYSKTSLKGEYCVYKKKFWYWKKNDGLFYLDEVYYK